jgi:hypothetical protein
MAHTAHWLFYSDGISIFSYSIASNGALKEVSSINTQKWTSTCGEALFLSLDHTGTTLYNLDVDFDCSNDTFQYFNVNHDTGALTYFGQSAGSIAYDAPLPFIGNNLYAYGVGCPMDSAAFYGFSRSSGGSLTPLTLNPPIPSYPEGDYCPALGAAPDPANDVAIPLYPETPTTAPGPPAQLAVYTADSSGNLNTNSTYENMPKTAVGYINDLVASPAGNLLAVAGSTGLQVFHYNGSNPITPYTGLLTTSSVGHVHWDNHNHLYAVSTGKLYVFTVTPTSHSQAPGSPHSIANAIDVNVLSK